MLKTVNAEATTNRTATLCRLVLVLLLFMVSPAAAQWQTPVNTVPVGRGPGVQGFNSMSGASCVFLTSAGSVPSCGTVLPPGVTVPLIIGTTTISSGTNKGLLYNNAGILGNLTSPNDGILITSSSGVPSIGNTLSNYFGVSVTNPTGTVPFIGFSPLTALYGISSNVVLGATGVSTGTEAIIGQIDNQKGGVAAGGWFGARDSFGSENYGIVGVLEPKITGSGALAGLFFRPNLAGTIAPNPVPYNGTNGISIVNEITNAASAANAAIGLYINSLCFPNSMVADPFCAPGSVADDTFVVGANIASARDEMLRFGSTTTNGYLPAKIMVAYNRSATPIWYTANDGSTHSAGYYLDQLSSDFKALFYDGTYTEIADSAGVNLLSLGNGSDPANYYNNTTHSFRSRNSATVFNTLDTNGSAWNGQAAKSILMIRNVTAATAGQVLTVQAGGAVSGGTDLSGGNLILSAGIGTGTAGGVNSLNNAVIFKGANLGATTGTSDNTPTEMGRFYLESSTFGTLCFSAASCSSTNFAFQGNNGNTIFNVGNSGTMRFRFNNTDVATIASANSFVMSTATGYIQTGATTVGTLPVCVAGTRSARLFVTDSNAVSYTAGIGSIVAGGGTTNAPVTCDGANWRIG